MHLPGMYHRLHPGKHKSKAEGDIQIQGPLTRLGSVAMFRHPTRINISYKLNVSVCHRRSEIMFKNSPGNKGHRR